MKNMILIALGTAGLFLNFAFMGAVMAGIPAIVDTWGLWAGFAAVLFVALDLGATVAAAVRVID